MIVWIRPPAKEKTFTLIARFLQMKHFQKFSTPYSTKLKLTLNPEGAQGALFQD
jgi:hypothetical protein